MTLPVSDWAQAGAALLAVLLLIWFAARVLRGGAAPRGAARRLRIEEAIALDSRRRLVLVRCDGREAVLLLGAGSETVLGWLPQEPKA